MKAISAQKTADVDCFLKQGYSYTDIASRRSLSKATICRISKTCLSNRQKCKTGRPKLPSKTLIRNMARKVVAGVLWTAVDARKWLESEHNIQVNAVIALSALREAGLRAAIKVNKPFLLKRHMKARLEFAKAHKHWTIEDWLYTLSSSREARRIRMSNKSVGNRIYCFIQDIQRKLLFIGEDAYAVLLTWPCWRGLPPHSRWFCGTIKPLASIFCIVLLYSIMSCDYRLWARVIDDILKNGSNDQSSFQQIFWQNQNTLPTFFGMYLCVLKGVI